MPKTLSSSLYISTGAYSWQLKPGYPSGEKCRILIRSVEDTSLSAYSGFFSIQGVQADPYEDDDSLPRAKSIDENGVPQKRTLTGQDRDWIRIAVIKGRRYLAPIRSAFDMEAILADSMGAVVTRFSGRNLRVDFKAAYSGNYLVSVHSSSYHGSYHFAFAEADSLRCSLANPFIHPDSHTTWLAGNPQEIQWIPDTLFFTGGAKLSLYRDSSFVQTLRESTTPDIGRYSWYTPVAFPSSNRYRIKMEQTLDARIRVFSPYFTIQGVTPDAYEPDNTKLTAKDIPTDGNPQARSFTGNDTDWTAFEAKPGKRYLVRLISTSICSVHVFDAAGTRSNLNGGRNFTLTVTPKASGRHFLRTRPSQWAESYSLMVLEYEAGGSVYPAQFIAPDSQSVWLAADPQTIRWKPDTTLFGNRVRLGLEKNGVVVWPFSSPATSTGSATLNIPKALGSSGKYRIKMSSDGFDDIFGYSEFFTIQGMQPDSLEPNDSAAAAKPLVPGQVRMQLSLDDRDKDWFRLDMKSQTLYTFLVTPESTMATTSLSLYPQPNGSWIGGGIRDEATPDSAIRFSWFSAADAPRYFAVSAYSTFSLFAYGSYGLEVKAYSEPEYRITIAAPAESATVVRNDTVLIEWSSRTGLDGRAKVFLDYPGGWQSTLLFEGKDSGSYSWKVPSSLIPGSGYSIRIERVAAGDLTWGTKRTFTISASP